MRGMRVCLLCMCVWLVRFLENTQSFVTCMQDRTPKRKADEMGQDEVSVGRAGRKTAETLNATDRIVEALELAGREAQRLEASDRFCPLPPASMCSSFLLRAPGDTIWPQMLSARSCQPPHAHLSPFQSGWIKSR